jgi:phosphatidylglycerophosphate synthase
MHPHTQTHVRINHGLLAGAEKRLLVTIAEHLPAWVTSDALTVLALLSMGGAGVSFWLMSRNPAGGAWGVVTFLALNWVGDSLDGTLARVRRQERPRFGYYVDHVLDITGATLLFTGLAVSELMTPVVAISVLAAYLLVTAELFLSTAVHGQFRMSFAGFGPTELRVVLAAGAFSSLRWLVVRPLGLGPFLLFDVGGVFATIGMLLALAVSTIRTIRELYVEEPLPGERCSARSVQPARLL